MSKTRPMVCCQKLCYALREGIIEQANDELAIPGCCGGGCYVLQHVEFCPFCGTEVEYLDVDDDHDDELECGVPR